jgi:hypothetical protein
LQKQDYKEKKMPQTLLARKSGSQDMAIATDDEAHQQLATDPSIPQFPESNSFGASNGFNVSSSNTSAFGSSPSAGFGSSPSYSAPSSSIGGSMSGSVPQPNLTQAGSNAAQGADVLVQHDKESSDWINKKWRPAMGWMYMLTCTVDFVVFPVLWSLLQALSKGSVTSQWQPLTLQGAGLYHIAMGAVLGIAAYGRTKEKLEGAAK